MRNIGTFTFPEENSKRFGEFRNCILMHIFMLKQQDYVVKKVEKKLFDQYLLFIWK